MGRIQKEDNLGVFFLFIAIVVGGEVIRSYAMQAVYDWQTTAIGDNLIR